MPITNNKACRQNFQETRNYYQRVSRLLRIETGKNYLTLSRQVARASKYFVAFLGLCVGIHQFHAGVLTAHLLNTLDVLP